MTSRYTLFGSVRSSSGGAVSDYRFTGQRQESLGNNWLYDYNGRFYNALIGRFLSADTIVPGAGNPQALNRYAYSLNNPIKFVDPSGHECQQPDGSACSQETASDHQGMSAAEILERDGYIVDEYGNWVKVGAGAPDAGYQSYFDQRAISWNGEWGTFSNGRAYNPEGGERNQWLWGKQAALAGKRDPLGTALDTIANASPSLLFEVAGAVVTGKSSAGVPQAAHDVADFAAKNGGAAQPGFVGNRPFANDGLGGGQKLPELNVNGDPITYREYDINPYKPGVNRGAERVVIGSDDSRYYTSDHYMTFTPY